MNNCALSQDGKVICYSDPRVSVGLTTVRYGDFKLHDNEDSHDYKLRELTRKMDAKSFFRIIPRHDSRIVRLNGKINGYSQHYDDADAVIYSSGNWAFLTLIHCSWITLRDKILEQVFSYLKNPSNLQAVIYSGICRDCYEVGQDVFSFFTYQDESYRKFFSSNSGTKMHLNLAGLIKEKLITAGIKRANIDTIHLCSLCGDFSVFNNREFGKMLYSHRRYRDEERNLIFTKLNGQNIFLAGTTGNCPYVILYI